MADHNYLYHPGMPFDASAILFDEAERLGLRFVLCRGGATLTRQLEAELPLALRPETLDAYLADIERLAAAYHAPAPDSFRSGRPADQPLRLRPARLRFRSIQGRWIRGITMA